jgi:hypothetical protein
MVLLANALQVKHHGTIRSMDIFDILKRWYNTKPLVFNSKQDCVDLISNTTSTADKKMNKELLFGAKLAAIGYALPYWLPLIFTKLHLKNTAFVQYFRRVVSETYVPAMKDMDQIVKGKTKMIELPNDNQVAGFYIRTPIGIWNKFGTPVYRLPSWEARNELLECKVSGNMNVYVLRRNLSDGFELYVLFRGTSNEFNGIPQYGNKYSNTPVFKLPEFDIHKKQFVKGGSETVPLFFSYYSEMILDVKEHIYTCLEKLHIDSDLCHRVLISGHSMGGALTLMFAYVSKFDHAKWWEKFQFRAYASPYCCNDTAAKTLEQWIIDSAVPHKYLDVVNVDDLVNVHYMFGGKNKMERTVSDGTNSFITWLLANHTHELINENASLLQNAIRIVQLYPEVAMAVFTNGISSSQSTDAPHNLKSSVRLGYRKSEVGLMGSKVLNQIYKRTLGRIFCTRRIQPASEYMGKSHMYYSDIDMTLFWITTRRFEDSLYTYYEEHSLKKHNQFRMVGLFSKLDRNRANNFINKYIKEEKYTKKVD